MKEIAAEELFTINNPIIIDIRSPIEFMDSAIPGAINVPLFSDKEREEVGILYTHAGSAAAKWRAMEIVSPKIPDMLQTIKEKSLIGEVVIYCWRGGARSKAVATFLEFAGIYVWRLIGGYRAYRHFILEKSASLLPEKAIVLHGLTGVGKTKVLKILQKKGYPILDLEEMAGHRGSIFGTIGLNDGNNQKTFDSLLFKGLQEIQESSYFLIEAESKRIGKTVQPEELIEKKLDGININLQTPIEQRVKHLISEYVVPYEQEPWYDDKISESIENVLRWVKNPVIRKSLLESLDSRNYPSMIRILLEHYYDPRYEHSRQDYEGEFLNIIADDPEDAAEKIIDQLEKLSFHPNLTFENQI